MEGSAGEGNLHIPELGRTQSNMDFINLWTELNGNLENDPFGQHSAGHPSIAAVFGDGPEDPSPAKKPKVRHSPLSCPLIPVATQLEDGSTGYDGPVDGAGYMPPTPDSAGLPHMRLELTQGTRDKAEAGSLWIRSNSRSAWMNVYVDAASEEQAAQIESIARSVQGSNPAGGLTLRFKIIYDDAHKMPIQAQKKGKHTDFITIMTRQGSDKSQDTIPLVCRNSFGVSTAHYCAFYLL